MKTPGFNAERSLYRTGGHYRTGGKAWSGSRMDSYVLPQQSPFCTQLCDECAYRRQYCPVDHVYYEYSYWYHQDCRNYVLYGVPLPEGVPAGICEILDRCEPGRTSEICSDCASCGVEPDPPPPDPPLPPPDGFCTGLVCPDGSPPISDGIHCLCRE
jgi:hypothetical protein